mmetsp:Transcript_8355/g.12571  ORF Transcript_8355/g.12571 Transcript_8355/m.12571 type:complete len:351 (+) Transcript_8355:118-1170(+)
MIIKYQHVLALSCLLCFQSLGLIDTLVVVVSGFSSPSPSDNPNKAAVGGTAEAAEATVAAWQQKYPFRKFCFAPNSVCTNPDTFYCPDLDLNDDDNDDTKANTKILEFKMRNVPGDGDCMFLAVALATSTSMGLGGNNALLNAVAKETRSVVAQVLSAPDGHLHVSGNRIVRAVDLLRSAAAGEGLTAVKYIEKLVGGDLQGGGPELTVLSNVLRRPISIYELDFDGDDEEFGKLVTGTGDNQQCEDYGGVNRNENANGNNQMETKTSTSSTGSTKLNGNIDMDIPPRCRIKRVGSFGDRFKDPCAEIPNPAVISGLLPGAYSWHIHILVVDAGPNEKHACALLPKECYI